MKIIPYEAGLPMPLFLAVTSKVDRIHAATLGLVFTGCIAAVRPAGHGCIELPKSSQGRCWQTVTAAGIGIVLDPLFYAASEGLGYSVSRWPTPL